MSTEIESRMKSIHVCDKTIEGIYLDDEHDYPRHSVFENLMYFHPKSELKIRYVRIMNIYQKLVTYEYSNSMLPIDLYNMIANTFTYSRSEIVIIDGKENRNLYDNELLISVHKLDDKYELKYNLGNKLITLECSNFADMTNKTRKIIYDYIDKKYPETTEAAQVELANTVEATSTDDDKIAELTKLLDEEREKSAKLEADLVAKTNELSELRNKLRTILNI